MEEVSIIGIDLAKRSFQVHGARADGSVAYRRKLSRGKLLGFLAAQPPCTVAMEACASAHYWGRETMALGHEVRLVPPIYVKPFVKRHKNDAADAEAITEAAQRPTMHFVAVKTEAQHGWPGPERQEFGFVGSWLDLVGVDLGPVASPGHIAASSVLLPCLGRPPSVSICDSVLVYGSQAARRPASISTALSCMSAHTNPASSRATATAAIWLFLRNASLP